MSQIPSIRLRPTETTFLNTQGFSSGTVFYDSMKNTLILMDGNTKGGYELLRADLSNIAGGGAGSGNVNFGARSITAQAFIGDGSQLTNLPIPSDVASQTYVNTAISTAINTPATTSTFGTVKVDGTSITITNGVISATGGDGGGGGIDLTAFSVGTPNTASGSGAISYDNTTGVFTYTPPNLSSFLTTYTETSTLNDVVGRNNTTTLAIIVENDITANTVNGTSGVFDDVTTDTISAGTISTSNIINTGTGVPRWTSGSDFIIDAAGDVNVVGSKITNLGTPTKSTDAATKAYVDGAASAFSGGTVTGAINITNNTASTSISTGALIVGGGAGISGDIYAGGLIYSNGSPVLTSDSGGWNGGIVGGTVFINNSANGTSTTTGNALRVLGSVGIQGNLNVGPDASFNGIRFGRGAGIGASVNTNVAIGGAGSAGDYPLAANVSGATNIAIGQKSLSVIVNGNGNVAVGYNSQGAKTVGDNNTSLGSNSLTQGAGGSNTAIGAGALSSGGASSSTGVGHDALILSAGSGNIGLGYLSGNLLATGDFNVIVGSNSGSTIDGTSNNLLLCDGAGNIKISADALGDVKVLSTSGSTSATTGALTVAGGLGVSGSIYASGGIVILDNTAATSTITGSIKTAGGIGVAGAVHADSFHGDGSNLTGVVSNTWAGGTVTGASNFTNTTASTSTITGAVRISGGLGVQGRVSAANFNGVTVPAGAVAPGANAFVRTEGTGYTYVGYINSNTTASENPVISQFIVTNATDTFYRKASTAHVKSGLGITPIIGTPASNYGAVAIQGEKNGWSGISFRNTANALCGTLMMSTTAQGIYAAADNAWLLQWDQAGNFVATANVSAYSDERLKTNIQVIPNALDKVMQLDGVTFNRISNGERGTGLVAQQLQKVLPEAVLADKEGMLSVAYGNTVGLLIEAMKEQQRQIETLRAEIAALKGQ